MGEILRAPRGTRDILPPETMKWIYAETVMRRIAEGFGFKEIRTPVFEQTELFSRGVGEGTDIVTKEMYTFQDKAGRSLTLRPEMTASAVRAYLESGLTQQHLVKWYYIGPGFRYERPQSGRYRQFHQFGVEAIGSMNPDLDAEIILLSLEIFKSFDLKDLEVKLNSIGCRNCRGGYRKALRDYFAPYVNKTGDSPEKCLCEDCSTHRFAKNPLRILDCKVPRCNAIAENAPVALDYLCGECGEHFQQVRKRLEILGVTFSLDTRLVRGLEYYTKTVFEVVSPALGAQNSLCGGGRYDNLVESLGGPSRPAAGFAAGIERLILSLQTSAFAFPENGLHLYIVPLGGEARDLLFPIMQGLRRMGLRVDSNYQEKSLGSQLKEADRLAAGFALIVGENEIAEKRAILRDMNSHEQEYFPLDGIERRLVQRILSGNSSAVTH